MKRRWALLLALSLTFASIPVTGAGAAEAAATADTEIVTEIAPEETPGDGVSVEEEAVVPTEEDGICHIVYRNYCVACIDQKERCIISRKISKLKSQEEQK
jgi:hypothetical protein